MKLKFTKLFILLYFFVLAQSVFAAKVTNFFPPVEFYVNRDQELLQLDALIKKYAKASLVGISGIGKTQTARQYAKERSGNYEVIWFFDCNLSLKNQFLQLVKTINENLIKPGEYELSVESKNLYEDITNYLNKRENQWLFIFDNLKINQNDRVKYYQQLSSKANLIFCSQDASNLPNKLVLSHLDQDSSVKLAQNLLTKTRIKDSYALVNEYGGYPLFLTRAAQFLASNGYFSFNGYKKMVINNDADDLVKHLDLVIDKLPKSSKKLMYKIIFLNHNRFSKDFLDFIAPKHDSLEEDLYNLHSFGLIQPIKNDNKQSYFEMHDQIQQIILNRIEPNLAKQYLLALIDQIRNVLPVGPLDPYFKLLNYQDSIPNFEILSRYAEQYQLDFKDKFEIKRALMNLYVYSRNYSKMEKYAKWYYANENLTKTNLIKQGSRSIALLVDYLSLIGFYQIDFRLNEAFTTLQKSERYINALEKSQQKLNGEFEYQELKKNIYSQLTQAYVSFGFINKAKELLDNQEPDIYGVYWVNKSKIYAYQGNYTEAIKNIDQFIETFKSRPFSLYQAIGYILKAEYLIYLNKPREAEELLLKNIYDTKLLNFNSKHFFNSFILAFLSRVDLSKNKPKDALIKAVEAKNIIINLRQNDNIIISKDRELTVALTSEGMVLSALKRYKEADDAFKIAQQIYINIYGDNIKNIDFYRRLILERIKVAKKLKDEKLLEELKQHHIKLFGI